MEKSSLKIEFGTNPGELRLSPSLTRTRSPRDETKLATETHRLVVIHLLVPHRLCFDSQSLRDPIEQIRVVSAATIDSLRVLTICKVQKRSIRAKSKVYESACTVVAASEHCTGDF